MARSIGGAKTKAGRTAAGKAGGAAAKPAKTPARAAKPPKPAKPGPTAAPASEARLSVAAALLRKSARRIGL